MGPVIPSVICLAVGAAAGAVAVILKMRPLVAARTIEIAALHARLADADAAQQQVAEMSAQASALRHDLRGILSPALLSADRLANSQDPASRKAADIVIRSVERATARLADKGQAQESSKSPLA
jgi:hypothetical protein